MTLTPVSDPRLPVSTAAFIPEDASLRRRPLRPERRRPEAFWQGFEARALVYDCFWNAAGDGVILVCPPALNLEPELAAARFTAAGQSRPLEATLYPSRSTTLIALAGVPATTEAIALEFAGLRFTLPIEANQSAAFAGRRVLVTMNKNNDLDWIAAWARWHVRLHGADGCILFDNGSTRYRPEEIATVLSAQGLAEVRVLSWPQLYGRKDPAVLDRPHYPHFLQVSSLNGALRRFGMAASGLLNCDIDELVSAEARTDVFTQAEQSPQGIVTLKGRWIEPNTDTEVTHGVPHLAYRHTHRLGLLSRCANKWVLDPKRDWVQDLTAKPSVHRLYDVPKSLQASAPVARFWHFKAINTGWKEARAGRMPWPLLLERPPALDADAARYGALASTA